MSKNKELLSKFFGGASAKEIGQAFQELDTDGSGELSWEEFEEGAERWSLRVSRATARSREAAGIEGVAGEGIAGGCASRQLASTPSTPSSTQVSSSLGAPLAQGSERIAQLVLVYGDGCGALGSMVAMRCGGTLLDLPRLIAEAEANPSEQGERLLALHRAGALPPFKEVLPVLLRTMNSCDPPFVLCGFPRMGVHVQQLEKAVGRVALAVQAGGASGTDAALGNWFVKAGARMHVAPEANDANVAAVLNAMLAAGLMLNGVGARGGTQRDAAATNAASEGVAAATIPGRGADMEATDENAVGGRRERERGAEASASAETFHAARPAQEAAAAAERARQEEAKKVDDARAAEQAKAAADEAEFQAARERMRKARQAREAKAAAEAEAAAAAERAAAAPPMVDDTAAQGAAASESRAVEEAAAAERAKKAEEARAEAEFQAAREREAEMWFPNEGTGEMLVEEGASDWSEDEF